MVLSEQQLRSLGFASIGKRVQVDERAAIFGASNIHLGDDVRIDCFAVITAGVPLVRLGRGVHIGAGAHIFGTAGVVIEDYAGLTGRASIYTTWDDFTGEHLSSPMAPIDLRQVHAAPVHLERHAFICTGGVVLPGVRMGKGSSVSPLSLVTADVEPFTVVAGNPAVEVGKRDRAAIEAKDAQLR